MVQNGRADQLAEVLAKLFGKEKTEDAQEENTFTQEANLEGVFNERREMGANEPLFEPQAKQTGQTPKTVAAELDLGGRQKIRVVSDPNNNALLIWGRESDYKKIENAVRKLDVIPKQVLIEVNIFEVTLNNDLRYGVEWYFSHGVGSRTAGGGGVFPALTGQNNSSYGSTSSTISGSGGGVVNNMNGNAANLGGQTSNLGIISQFNQGNLPGFSYFLQGAGGDIRAMVNLLEQVSSVNMLASPHLLVSDHQSARIRVGQEIPLQLGQGVTAVGAVSNYDYRETGVLLSVTPHINPGGLISLQISQEVSTPNRNNLADIQSPVIDKRALDTLIVANSGETLALGGLIRDDQMKGRSGIPFLSELPLLGPLFGSKTRTSSRTELLLTMTPKVIANNNQAKEASEELRAKMKAIGDTFFRR
jgi:general secretion pathway protein D